MIVSVSRRTDIPTWYSEWFFNRLDEGFVYVRNPLYLDKVSKVELNPKTVDCFVFWTKNAIPMMKNIHKLDGYNYYFQYTITGYNSDVEQNIHNKPAIIENFKELSKMLGKKRVVLRYDPIFFNEKYTIEYHCEAFKRLMEQVGDYTERCVISFIDFYNKTEKNMKIEKIKMDVFKREQLKKLAKNFVEIAKKYNVVIESCAEEINLDELGIKHGSCIDGKLIEEIVGYEMPTKKDGQRTGCNCVECVDIGEYNTCKNLCAYCYANFDKEKVAECSKAHDPHSPYLVGNNWIDEENISVRKMDSYKERAEKNEIRARKKAEKEALEAAKERAKKNQMKLL